MRKINHWLKLYIIISTGLLIGCKKNQSSIVISTTEQENNHNISGQYSYKGFNRDSVMVVFGAFEINQQDSLLTGQRNIQRVDTLQTNFSEEGTGEIEGIIFLSGEINISLTPTKAASLEIEGTIEEGIYKGKRLLNTGGGPIPQHKGSFIAEKID